MNSQTMKNTLDYSFKIGNIAHKSKRENVNLALINRNIEERLNQDLSDIEFEMKHIEGVFAVYPDGSEVYSTLFKTLHRDIAQIDELFFELDYLDQLNVSLLLEKIKKRIQKLREKVKVCSTFVYSREEISA